jgi:hypothetical protein
MVVELVIVTTGVLIALLLEGLLEWNHYRLLVREARATIARELEDNKREVDEVAASQTLRKERLESAQRFADELLRDGKTDVTELQLGFPMADVTAAAWYGAEQTGALGHMDFSEVQSLSRLYDLQEMFVNHQRRSLEVLTEATALFGVNADPLSAGAEDLRLFRRHVLTLKALLGIEQQLTERLIQRYQEALKR